MVCASMSLVPPLRNWATMKVQRNLTDSLEIKRMLREPAGCEWSPRVPGRVPVLDFTKQKLRSGLVSQGSQLHQGLQG